MINRSDIIWLGASSGVTGALTGGILLFVAMTMIVSGNPLGWLFLVVSAPLGALIGWLLARRLAQQAGSGS